MAVDGQDLRITEDCGVAHLFESLDEDAHLVAEDADVEAGAGGICESVGGASQQPVASTEGRVFVVETVREIAGSPQSLTGCM